MGVNVNTDVLVLRKGKGDGGAEVEVGEVDGAEEGIIGHHRVEGTVEGSEREAVSVEGGQEDIRR